MKCPGQDSRYWDSGAIYEADCPKCGHPVEFFKDETARKCRNCGERFVNPRLDFGCASYCRFADQCLGDLPPEAVAKREELLKDRVAIEMKRYFERDFRRIAHATKVAGFAQRIVMEEKGDPAVVVAAAYLHDVGIKDAERLYNSSAARYQEELGPPVAREILAKLGARIDLIEEVCDIIAHHHHPRDEETVNFKCLYDADLIVNMEENHKDEPLQPDRLSAIIAKSFLTESGKRIAAEALVERSGK